MPNINFSDNSPDVKRQFAKHLQTFLAYCYRTDLSPEELEQPNLFFNAPQVKNLLSFGAENQDFLPPLVAALAEIKEMPAYRASLVGYLIGLYAENGLSNPKTDMALAEFYLQNTEQVSEYLWQACRSLGVEPANLAASAGVDEQTEERRQALIERLRNLTSELSEIPQMPEQAIQAWHGLSPLSFGMMSRLAASQNLRDFFRQHNDGEWLHGLCSLLSEWHEAVGFIPYMLDLQEEHTALVLSPSTRQGVEVKLRQIDSNNLFFTLLQFALYHQNLLKSLGAAEFNYQPLIEKLALHEPIPPEEYPEHIYEQGCLGYYNWRALRPDGHFDEMQAVWGEGIFQEIPQLNGRTLLLVGRPQIQRSWGGAFVTGTHINLQPQVQILRLLPEAEVQQWLDAIAAENNNNNE